MSGTRHGIKRRIPLLVALLVGTLLAGGAVAAFFLAEEWSIPLATALAVLALFSFALLPGRYTTRHTFVSGLRGSAAALSAQARALGFTGRAVFIPATGNLSEERVFLPAVESSKPLPTLDMVTLLYEAPADRKVGIAFPPPGLALLADHEAQMGRSLKGASLPEAQTFLAALGANTGLFSSVALTQREAGVLRFSYVAPRGVPCVEEWDSPLTPCEQGGCPVCSALLAGVARALERAVEVRDQRVDGRRVTFELRLEAEV